MRTALFLVAGFMFMGVCLILGKLFAPQYPDAPRLAAIAYVAAWLVVAAANMWMGVAKAGYTIGEELPIFLLIFAVPAVVLGVLKWKFF